MSRSSSTQRFLLDPAILSLVAGSIAGAIGVGVSFPFDSIKTKAQTMHRTVLSSPDSTVVAMEKMNVFQLIALIWEREGIAGFFSGVKGMMMGQAIIKAVAFSVNANTLTYLQTYHGELPTPLLLLMASCLAGFLASFFVSPIEFIKVRMQTSSTNSYANELECLQAIVKAEGWYGFLTKGLGTTLAREVPSYGIYFWIYALFSTSPLAALLPGLVAPLLFGALSGMSSWLPIYPRKLLERSSLFNSLTKDLPHNVR